MVMRWLDAISCNFRCSFDLNKSKFNLEKSMICSSSAIKMESYHVPHYLKWFFFLEKESAFNGCSNYVRHKYCIHLIKLPYTEFVILARNRNASQTVKPLMECATIQIPYSSFSRLTLLPWNFNGSHIFFFIFLWPT